MLELITLWFVVSAAVYISRQIHRLDKKCEAKLDEISALLRAQMDS